MIHIGKRDIVWSYIGTVLSIFSNIILLPFILFYLTNDEYGLWSIFQSIGGITVLFDFGFSVTFARNIAYSWSGARNLQREGGELASSVETDFFFLKKVLRTCRWIYLLISLIALLLLSSVGTTYILRVSCELDGIAHLIAWSCYVIAVFMNLYFGYFNAALRGVGDVADSQKATVVAKTAQIVITIALLWSGMGLIGTGIAYLAYGVLFRLLARRAFYRYESIGRRLSNVDADVTFSDVLSIFVVVWHNAWKDGVVTLANYLSNQASTVICSLYLPLAETGTYSLAMQLATAVVNVSATMYNTYQPVLQSAYITGNEVSMRRSMSLVTVSYVVLYTIGTVAVVMVGLPVLRLIRSNSVPSVPVFFGVALYQFILKYRNCFTSYFACTNRIPYVGSFVASSIACVILELFSMGPCGMGVWGLISAQIFSQLAFNAWYWPLKAHKELELTPYGLFRLGSTEIKEKATIVCKKKIQGVSK